MIDQMVLTIIWMVALLCVMIRCAIRRTTLWTTLFLLLMAIPLMDKHMFPDPIDPEQAYMQMTKDLPYQLGDWRIDMYPECCYIYPNYRG